MDSSFSSRREALAIASGESSLAQLLTFGLQNIREGRYVEGITYFSLVRERLPPEQIQLAAALDKMTKNYIHYSNAQEELFQACKRFVRAEAEQQAHVDVIENLLPNLEGQMTEQPYAQDFLEKNAESNQLLHIHQSTSPNLNWEKPFAQPPELKSEDTTVNQHSPALKPLSEDSSALPALYVTCFGRFEVNRAGKTLDLRPNRKGQAILRYLIAQEEHRATMDMLMGILWPEEEPEVAQRKLYLAVSALRCSLNHGSAHKPGNGYLMCKNRVYHFNPTVEIRTDVDEYLRCYQAGQRRNEERVVFYEKACYLYRGPFLPEDVYSDWSFLRREQLSKIFLSMCGTLTDHYLSVKHYEDAAKWAISRLKENHCDEVAYRQLIQIYIAQGRRSEALQQYQRCEHILREELGVHPLSETVRIFQTLLAGESTSTVE
jgi:DNA-binding SARP family transcriptional activator